MFRRFLKFLDTLIERKMPRNQVGRHAMSMSSLNNAAMNLDLPRSCYIPVENVFQHIRHSCYVPVGDMLKHARLCSMIRAFPERDFLGLGPDARAKHAKRLVQCVWQQWGVNVSWDELLELRGSHDAQKLLDSWFSGNGGGG